MDSAGNVASADRTVMVMEIFADTDPPNIRLIGPNEIIIIKGDTYTDPGVTATDLRDPNPIISIAPDPASISTENTDTIVFTYTATDKSGNIASITQSSV